MTTIASKSDATETTNTKPASSLVDTFFDVGTQWAALGLKFGKLALEQGARTLESTAKTLETLAVSLEPKTSTKEAPKTDK